MGFFAGFGESFSRSFENQRQRSAEREDDLFRMKFQEFARRREKEDTLRLQDSKDVEKAKSFIMGTPGIPPEALGIVYNWVKSGMDDSWIVDQLKADKFSVKNTDAQADIQSPSDEQMGDMGMGQSETAPASPEASAAPQQASFDGGGFLSQIFPGMKKFERPSRNARVDQRMSEVTGMTPEEMNKPYESPSFDTSGVEFTPGATADAPSNLIEAQQQLDAAMANLKANPNDPAALEAVAKATQMYQSTLAGASTQGRIDAIAQNPGSLGTQEVVVTDPETGDRKSVV